MSELRLLLDLWPLIVALVGVTVWLVRLESKSTNEPLKIRVRNLEEKVIKLNAQHEALDSEVMKRLTELGEAIARIEGALGVKRVNKK